MGTKQAEGQLSFEQLAGDQHHPRGFVISRTKDGVKCRIDDAGEFSEEDAKLIVRACNAHDGLVKALQNLKADYEKLLVESRITKRDADQMRELLPEYTKEADVALEKAK